MLLHVVMVFLGAVAILALVSADLWLPPILGQLDRVLTRLGVGTWAAGFLTWAEKGLRRRRERRGRRAAAAEHPGTRDARSQQRSP